MLNPNDISLNIVCGEIQSIIYLNGHASPPQRGLCDDSYCKVMGDSRKYPYLYHGRLLGFPKGRGGGFTIMEF